MNKTERKTTKTTLIIRIYIAYGGDDCNIVTTYEPHQRNRIATRCTLYYNNKARTRWINCFTSQIWFNIFKKFKFSEIVESYNILCPSLYVNHISTPQLVVDIRRMVMISWA